MKEVQWLSDQELAILKLFDEANISVTSVKYSKGHDADCMNANLKIGSKIVGTVYDDSWGGDFQYDGEKVQDFLEIFKEIRKIVGTYKFKGMELDFDDDILVQLLISHQKNKRDCKNKTVIFYSKKEPTEEEISMWGVKEATYDRKYSPTHDKQILNDFKIEEKEGFGFIEIVNKRYA